MFAQTKGLKKFFASGFPEMSEAEFWGFMMTFFKKSNRPARSRAAQDPLVVVPNSLRCHSQVNRGGTKNLRRSSLEDDARERRARQIKI